MLPLWIKMPGKKLCLVWTKAPGRGLCVQSLMHRVQCQMGILQFHLNAKTHVPLLGVLTSTIAGPQLSLLPVQILSVYLYAPLVGAVSWDLGTAIDFWLFAVCSSGGVEDNNLSAGTGVDAGLTTTIPSAALSIDLRFVPWVTNKHLGLDAASLTLFTTIALVVVLSFCCLIKSSLLASPNQ